MRTYVYSILAGLFLLAVSARCAQAEAITFKLCGDAAPTFRAPAGTDRLEVSCPGKPAPVLTILGCIGPKVTRVGAEYTVACTRIVTYKSVPQ